MKITSIISESQHKCPYCGGPVVEYSELEEGKKDACYYKVKASAKVWPSAYASGRLVQCRKKGASNYGKGKNESVAEDQLDEKWSQKYKSSINCSNPKGFSQKAHCAGKKKNEGQEMKFKDVITMAEAANPAQQAAIAIAKKKKKSVAESSQPVDSLVTDALKLMRGPEANDAVRALKTVLGDREYNQRRGHYNFYVRQLLDKYGQQGVTEGKDIDARISNLKDAIRSETPRSVPGEDHREQYARHAEKIAGYKAELKKLVAQKKQQGVAEGSGDRRRFIRHNIWTAMDSDEEVLQHAVEGDPFYSAKKFMRDLDDQGYDFTHVISPEGEITYSPQHDPRHLKNFPDQGVAEDLSRRGFLKGLGAAAAGAAGLGASGAAQARATPEWMAKVAQAKELFNKGLSPEQVAKKLGVSGPNNNMAGPMGGDWGAINYAYREVQRSRGIDMNEEFNPEYNDEAGMAHGSLLTVKRAVDGLMSTIDRGDDLPEWCQEKISLAEDYLVTVWDYIQSEKAQGIDPEIEEMYEAMDELAEEMAHKKGVSVDLVWETFEAMDDNMLYETAAWRRKEGKSKKGGLNAKGVASYRRENPGSKLQMAVTTKPSKLKPGSKAAKRRKSFCARMSGVKGPMKKPNGKPTRKALALRKWNC